MKTGWMCPRCGVCWSPKVERCECKPQATAPQYVYPYWPPLYWPPYYGTPWRVTYGGVTTVSGSSGGNYTINAGTSATRIPGLHAGQAWMSDDFDAPLDGEMGFGEG